MSTIDRPYFVTFYDHELRYGGPEEGGWHYTQISPTCDELSARAANPDGDEIFIDPLPPIACSTRGEAIELSVFLNAWDDEIRREEGRAAYSSVLSGFMVRALVETVPYSLTDVSRPRYE